MACKNLLGGADRWLSGADTSFADVAIFGRLLA